MPPRKFEFHSKSCSGSGGIGSALTLTFQKLKFQVFASVRDVSNMSALEGLSNVTYLVLDVTDPQQIQDTVELVRNKCGGSLDILINNAGRNHFSPVLDIGLEEAKKIYDINVWSPLMLIQKFAPLFISAKGSIINVTYISGYVNVPYMGLYAASKRSLEILSETLRLELQPFGVHVPSIVTGAVQTNGQTYFEDWKLPQESLYKPIESIIHKRARGGDVVLRTNTMEYAEQVVKSIVGRNSDIGLGAAQTLHGQRHAVWFYRNTNDILERGRIYFGDTKTLYSITLAGGHLCVITGASDIQELYRNSSTITWNNLIKDMYSIVGLSPRSISQVWNKTHEQLATSDSKKSTRSAHEMTSEYHRQQLLTAVNAENLVQRIIPGLEKSLSWNILRKHPACIRTSGESITLSLWNCATRLSSRAQPTYITDPKSSR
ncbi:putative nadph-dependent 1-acyldihydroxyacetone phosphate reductase protein [Botrytis fragariae]|uniref:Putative nadph-dependent 1-acyldihydroxyacetone phosphate reductase protein n=1 Tax=Botrytis fragariae TaxID=1964551 RepID=A0A8H6EGN8_9HELO|nr:putative nadph-dependent 1-acyldihydroxyacetone phosphate reductase protein [Botrytis fragariae]KAF5871215.1 putative nadph-dependent 1-acyldihydroxyacetone phosphate reductase protein [Botrytis fragariae]